MDDDAIRRSPLAMDAATFRALGHRLVDQLAEFLESLPRGPVTRNESPSAVREALDLTGPASGIGDGARGPAGADGAAAVRSLAVQRTPALLRLHHRATGADRDPRRLSRRGGQPERRRLDAVAGRHRDRVADGAMDRRAHRLPGRLRRAARQRRQHGELRLLAGGARGEGRLGRARARRRRRFGTQASRLCARPKRTPGFRRPPTLRASAPPSIRWIPTDARLRMDVDALRRQIEADAAAGRRAVPRRRNRRVGQHRRRRSAAGHQRALQGVRRVVSRRWRLRRFRGGASRGVRRPARAQPGRFGRRRSAQVALCAARGRMRAGARSGGAARRLLVPPALLSFRGAGDQLCRLRPAELARLPRPQGVARPEARRRRRLPHDDRRRHPPVSGDGRGGRPACGAAAHHSGPEHHDIPLRAARSSSGRRRAGWSNAISMRSTASCSIGCSAEARRSSPTPSSAAATCCAPAS